MAAPSEQALIDEVRQRLIATYARLAPATVVLAVSEAQERFVDCPVRDFVPLLVERRAIKALLEHSAPMPAARAIG
ncbi:three-helix bundle dimerization domain-containing protein [Mycobacterium sp.]|uniref:three-helix bundle dimerization domain-containing protein n=1 Tax=Mycobacterium sp. TaxID=1785 RepID=UPI002CF9ED44|nr:hypothetical protein [Mycobacterium sp.]HME46548.1 hypothetical protein [Mycobacterium sp.]